MEVDSRKGHFKPLPVGSTTENVDAIPKVTFKESEVLGGA